MSWDFLPGDLKEERRREEQYRRMRQLNDSCVQRRFTTSPRARLLLAVVAVGVRAAAVARVDVAGGGHVEGAVEVVAGALAVELAGAEVDVRGAVAVHPRLGLEAVGAGVAGVEGNCTSISSTAHTSTPARTVTHPFATQHVRNPCGPDPARDATAAWRPRAGRAPLCAHKARPYPAATRPPMPLPPAARRAPASPASVVGECRGRAAPRAKIPAPPRLCRRAHPTLLPPPPARRRRRRRAPGLGTHHSRGWRTFRDTRASAWSSNI
jgi:hypothetical protein